jgi:hypothetical protein
MIVGFDGDDPGIFARQHEFAMATAVPIFSLGTLVAPVATPLHARLARDGRLVGEEGSEVAAAPWNTNIIPKLMTRDELFEGVRWLCNAIYRPDAFEERVARMIATFGRRGERAAPFEPTLTEPRAINVDSANLIQKMSRLGPAELRMFANIMKMLRDNRAASRHVMGALVQYYQVRYMYERGSFWEPQIAPATTALWLERRQQAPALALA